MDRKIDFVIAWVDGSDPEWQKQMLHYRREVFGEEAVQNYSVRYRDWDNLHYWFRAVEKYAPWVNRVHLLTWGHIPAWLNTECPKLNIVKHSDFIPEKYLPTFSSHPIELNMHRIPGLSEQFVYFNDDFFLTAPVEPTDFFQNGLPCDSLEENPICFSRRELMNNVNSNDIIFINRLFKKNVCRRNNLAKWYSLKTPKVAIKNLILSPVNRDCFFGLNYHHLPQAYLKKSLEAVWELDPVWLDETSSRKFRSGEDVSQCVIKYYQFATGAFAPYDKCKNGRWFYGGTDPVLAARAIRNKTYKFICYNDSSSIDFELARTTLQEAFQSVLPEKSCFEK